MSIFYFRNRGSKLFFICIEGFLIKNLVESLKFFLCFLCGRKVCDFFRNRFRGKDFLFCHRVFRKFAVTQYCGVGSFVNQIFNAAVFRIAGDEFDFFRSGNFSGYDSHKLRFTVIIRIDENDVAGFCREISGKELSFRIEFEEPSFAVGFRYKIGDSRIFRTEGNEHCAPVAVRVAVFFAVAGVAFKLFAHKDYVFGAFGITDLAFSHRKDILCPVSAEGDSGKGSFPIVRGFGIGGAVNFCVDAFRSVFVFRNGADKGSRFVITAFDVGVDSHSAKVCFGVFLLCEAFFGMEVFACFADENFLFCGSITAFVVGMELNFRFGAVQRSVVFIAAFRMFMKNLFVFFISAKEFFDHNLFVTFFAVEMFLKTADGFSFHCYSGQYQNIGRTENSDKGKRSENFFPEVSVFPVVIQFLSFFLKHISHATPPIFCFFIVISRIRTFQEARPGTRFFLLSVLPKRSPRCCVLNPPRFFCGRP